MPARASDSSATVEIQRVRTERVKVTIIGTTPLVCNRMSEKAKRELLLPPGRKTAAAKAASLKHDPLEEFRASPYRLKGEDQPTLIGMPSTAFKGAMATAALDLSGAKKAQIGRLVYVEGEYVPIYGEPKLLMSVVRMADINHTPDIRTRAILPDWGCQITVRYVVPIINETNIGNLIAAAGTTVGVGDYRQEKGKGNYGLFEIVEEDDPRFLALRQQGKEVQELAMAEPAFHDQESADLMEWYEAEVRRRGLRTAS